MELLFLDTYFINGARESIGFYEFLKDVVVPGIVLFFTIKYSIKVAKSSFDRQSEKEEEQKYNEEKSILELLEATNPKLISNLREQIDILEKVGPCFCLDNFKTFSFYKPNKTLFDSIKSFGFHRIYSVITNFTANDRECFVKYWKAIADTPVHQEHIENYNEYVLNTYNRLNDELNKLTTKRIAVECSKIIHKEFPPYTVVDVSGEEFESDPDIAIALMVKEAFDVFRTPDSVSRLRKIKNFLQSLDDIKNDPVACKALDAKLAQEISNALGVMRGIEEILKVAKKSYENYAKTLGGSLEILESFTFKAEI